VPGVEPTDADDRLGGVSRCDGSRLCHAQTPLSHSTRALRIEQTYSPMWRGAIVPTTTTIALGSGYIPDSEHWGQDGRVVALGGQISATRAFFASSRPNLAPLLQFLCLGLGLVKPAERRLLASCPSSIPTWGLKRQPSTPTSRFEKTHTLQRFSSAPSYGPARRVAALLGLPDPPPLLLPAAAFLLAPPGAATIVSGYS
jgi:hypothetical protein